MKKKTKQAKMQAAYVYLHSALSNKSSSVSECEAHIKSILPYFRMKMEWYNEEETNKHCDKYIRHFEQYLPCYRKNGVKIMRIKQDSSESLITVGLIDQKGEYRQEYLKENNLMDVVFFCHEFISHDRLILNFYNLHEQTKKA